MKPIIPNYLLNIYNKILRSKMLKHFGLFTHLGPAVYKAFSLNGGYVKNIKQAYELLTKSKLNFSVKA